MKGFIGSANIDTNSRLCMASAVAGHKRAFGADAVPGCYEDLEEADLVVLVGSNLAWCHPILYQRLAAAREKRGTRVVVVDPRRTATCDIADRHLAIEPDGDVALFAGLLAYLDAHDNLDREWIAAHTTGFKAALAAAGPWNAGSVAARTGLAPRDIVDFCAEFAATARVVTVFSQGVNQSACGTDKANAIINCHLATGRIGQPGMGPFSVTGQPNAMGGREVGGLANMLAAHMDIGNPAHRDLVRGFWRAPAIPERAGLKAVDMFRAVGDGRIKAIWIMATNPVVSMPEADAVKAALAQCPFVVVSDVVRDTDTTALAHVLLPSTAWGEKSGTVTNSERTISRQRPFLAPPGEARPDWSQMAEVGKRLGFGEAFDYAGPHAVFAEHAALSGHDNDGTRAFDIGALADVSAADYEHLAAFQWPRPATPCEAKRLYGDGRFHTADGRARFVPTPPATPVQPRAAFVLNTGRIRDQWHTMTRTAKTARLMSHFAEPFLELNPADAAHLGLSPADLVTVESAHGRAMLRALVTPRVPAGHVFAPMHWNDQYAARARIDALIAGRVDPVSGQPALKRTEVGLARYPARWFAFAAGAARPATDGLGYWAVAPARGGWRAELADATDDLDAEALLARLWPGLGDRGEVLRYRDAGSGETRHAVFEGGRLAAVLFAGPRPVACARQWLAGEIGQAFDDPARRQRVLAGQPGAAAPDKGAIVCACFEVGRNEIVTAIRQGAESVEGIGRATRAGTNCGSCRSEIGGLVRACCGEKVPA
jgi:assimilatory nitrate reductase catalytic subunit